MKSFFLIICVTAFVALSYGDHVDEDVEKLKQYATECNADPATALNKDLAKKAFKGEKVDDPSFGVFARCVLTKTGAMKANGEIDDDYLKDKLSKSSADQETVDAILNHCSKKKDTPEETAKELLKCFAKLKDEDD